MSLGMAMDAERVAFLAYPSAKELDTNLGGPLALLEERTSGTGDFLKELADRAGIVLVRRHRDVTGQTVGYVVPEPLGDGPEASLLELNPRDLQMLVMTRSEFDGLVQLNDASSFDDNLPVYLGVDVETGPAPDIERIKISLRGYDTAGSGPQLVTIDSGITILSPAVTL